MFATILTPVAEDKCSWDAAEQSRDLARALGSTLMLLDVVQGVEPTNLPSSGFEQALAYHRISLEHEGDRVVARMLTHLGFENACGLTRVAYSGESVAQVILDAAQELHADLILMGTHERDGLIRLLEGSVAEAVMRHAPCPVMTVRHRDPALEH
jgi:nucleotide-binding universal stress UspA family protein